MQPFFHISFQGNEQVVFFTPGLAPAQNVYAAQSPMAASPMQFSTQSAPQVTGMSVSSRHYITMPFEIG